MENKKQYYVGKMFNQNDIIEVDSKNHRIIHSEVVADVSIRKTTLMDSNHRVVETYITETGYSHFYEIDEQKAREYIMYKMIGGSHVEI